ncbi:MAG: rod shape-determining protein [Pseudomonadota bacterium]
MFGKTISPATTKISVDLGGDHTRIFDETDGLILDEPSVGLLNMDHRLGGSKALECFGLDAVEAAPDTSSKRLVSVLQSDIRNPLGYSTAMLRYFFSKLRKNGRLGRAPVVLLTIPPSIEQLLTDDLKHACFAAGASRVHLVDNAISSAIGAGLAIESSQPHMLLDLGARDARLYAFQFNEIVAAYSLPFGGRVLDEILANGIRERYGLYVSETHAREAKHLVGRAQTRSPEITLDVQQRTSCQMSGLQINDNEQVHFTLTTEVACELLQPAIRRGGEALAAAVQALPYQFRDPQQQVAIVMTGGGAHLPLMDQMVAQVSQRPVDIAGNPGTTVAHGGAILLAQIHREVTRIPSETA